MFDWNRPECIPVYPDATRERGRRTGTKPGGFQTIANGGLEGDRERTSDGSDSYRWGSSDVIRCVGFQTMFVFGGEDVARAAWLSTLAAWLASFLSQNGTPRTTVPPTVAEAPQDGNVRFRKQQPLSLSPIRCNSACLSGGGWQVHTQPWLWLQPFLPSCLTPRQK